MHQILTSLSVLELDLAVIIVERLEVLVALDRRPNNTQIHGTNSPDIPTDTPTCNTQLSHTFRTCSLGFL